MAERKSALKRAPSRPELDRLLEENKKTPITDELLRQQTISFVYGNAPKGSKTTRQSAERAVNSFRITDPSSV